MGGSAQESRQRECTPVEVIWQAGINRVQVLMARAVDTLDDLLDAKKYPSIRLGAARIVAELGMHHHDAETIIRRLDEIEARQRQQDADGRR